jgi:hypothetical protein
MSIGELALPASIPTLFGTKTCRTRAAGISSNSQGFSGLPRIVYLIQILLVPLTGGCFQRFMYTHKK